MKEAVTKVEKGQTTDSLNLENKSVITSPMSPQAPQQNNNSRLNTKKEQRSGNTLYQELSYHVSIFFVVILKYVRLQLLTLLLILYFSTAIRHLHSLV